jgi:uncharacterized protein YbgA (DUF1722 family)/uncharacterized protein YbbK (DUF523 family)
MEKKPLVGISTCLLGENVRHDGGHKLNLYLRDTLGKYVDYIAVCPEVECGMGVPREAVHLVDLDGDIRLITTKTNTDMTEKMKSWMEKRLKDLSKRALCGFIFKSKSPSSGLFNIKVRRKNSVRKNGTGIFARGFTERFPLISVEEDERLNDDRLRENFIERIFLMHRWYTLNEKPKSLKKLMDFHAVHKYLLMAHSPETLKDLGRLLAQGRNYSLLQLYNIYFESLLTSMRKIATVKKNTNVLSHLMGYFKKNLNHDEKAEIKNIIERYHAGHIPLIIPITMINRYVKKYKSEYLKNQFYLNPGPPELTLQNHKKY